MRFTPLASDQRDPRSDAPIPHLRDWSSLPPRDRDNALVRCRDRMATLGRSLQAVAHAAPERASGPGPLAALPYAVKDMIATGATTPGWGCSVPVTSDIAPSSIVTRLDAAGACLIGIAEMTELAYEPSGLNSSRVTPRNPWNVDAAPGGSSSGSAVLVASGCCFVALGSDTGGSVRIPAHCCGITALKPTWGALPLDGAMPLAPSLDTIGIMARSAADVALVRDVLAGPASGGEATTVAVLDDAFAASQPEIAQICREAVATLERQKLAVVGRAGFPDDADAHALTIMQYEAAVAHRDRIDDPRVDAVLRRRLGKGRAIAADAYAAALEARAALRESFIAQYLADAAAVALPVMPLPTPLLREVDPRADGFSPKTLYALSRFTRFVNYLGLPAVALPVGFNRRGLPVGLQLVGRPGDDALLLGLAMRFQAVTDWHGRVPGAVAPTIVAEEAL